MNHAYGLNDVFELEDPFGINKDEDGKVIPYRLMRIRNPWGKSEWLGAWSDESEQSKKYADCILEYIHTLPPDE